MKILSQEINVKGNSYDVMEAYLDYKKKHLEINKKENESIFDDYRDIDQEEIGNIYE